MKLNFTEKEKEEIFEIVKEYESINDKMDNLKKQSEEIEKKVNECNEKLKQLSEKETKLIDELHQKYGKFNIQDISDTIYGRK